MGVASEALENGSNPGTTLMLPMPMSEVTTFLALDSANLTARDTQRKDPTSRTKDSPMRRIAAIISAEHAENSGVYS